jgi:hypothetical protein
MASFTKLHTPDLLVFQASKKKTLGQKNGSFLLLIVKLLYIYVGSRPGLTGLPGSWVDLPGQPGFTGFFLLLVFCLTQTGSATESRVNPPGRSGFNNTGLHTKSHEKSSTF